MSVVKIGYFLSRIFINMMTVREKRLSVLLLICIILFIAGCADIEQNNTVTVGDISVNAEIPEDINLNLDGELVISATAIYIVRYEVETDGVIEEICKLLDADQLFDSLLDIRDAESLAECPAT